LNTPGSDVVAVAAVGGGVAAVDDGARDSWRMDDASNPCPTPDPTSRPYHHKTDQDPSAVANVGNAEAAVVDSGGAAVAVAVVRDHSGRCGAAAAAAVAADQRRDCRPHQCRWGS